jgi:predicted ribosome quality control (RQC) complex YloA/Tae2 family protein
VWHAPRAPVLLTGDGRVQPYGVVLEGEPLVVQESLLDAFEAAARAADAVPLTPDRTDMALDAVAQRIDALDARRRRMDAERAGAEEEAAALKLRADLLLSQLHAVQRGAEQVELDDFQGGTVHVTLDPALSPADNARSMYDSARRRGRAAARLPKLAAAVQQEVARMHALLERIRDGAVPAAELASLARRRSAPGDKPEAVLPYRAYRTTGGLEVRVGRGARGNDELTFRHSSPGDIWLHARDVAGAHVILRWSRQDQNPPARDIEEAAVLAAMHSRARTSGTVAVDWTRRKYVRKPRKAAPGLVIPERVRTVFVAPDATLEERLRVEF